MRTAEKELLILSSLLYNTITSSSAVSILLNDTKNTSSLLHKMNHEKKIKEREYHYKSGVRNHTHTYYTLTDTGLYFLLDHSSYLPFPIPSPSFPYQYLPYSPPGKTVSNLLHEVTANTFFSTIPHCTTFPIYFSSGLSPNTLQEPEYDNTITDEERKGESGERTLIYSLLEPIEQNILSSFHSQSFPTDYLFTPSCIFRHTALRNENISTYKDLCYSQFSGILSNSSTSFLVYTGTSDGLSWNKKTLDIEKRTLALYNFQHGITDDSLYSGLLLIKTPRDLISVYNDSAKRRTINRDLNHSLYSLYTIPMDGNGKQQIEHLFLNDIDNYKETFLENLLSTPHYTSNTDPSSPFPILHCPDNTPCYYGFDMDIISLKNLPEEDFDILCRPYQTPYYSTIFPSHTIRSFS